MNKIPIKSIIIACCTYKRAEFLKLTLESLMQLSLPDAINVEILIVDNDKDKSAQTVVEKYNNNPIKINYCVEEKVGLANVRNKALNMAIELDGTHLAFIDDDEVADKNWIIEHVKFYNEYENIHISSGPTYTKFMKKYPNFIENNNIYKKTSTKKQGLLRQNCATGNVFLPLNVVTESNLLFNSDYNFIGGEDGEFFLRVTSAGYNIGWNNLAVNYALIDDERANVKWILTRNYYNGHAGAIFKFKNKKVLLKRIVYSMEKTVTVIINLIATILSLFLGLTCFVNSLGITAKNAGKLVGAIYLNPINYYIKREE